MLVMVQKFQLDKYKSLDLNTTQDDRATQTTQVGTMDLTTTKIMNAEILEPGEILEFSQKY
jgi:hypothetical protein